MQAIQIDFTFSEVLEIHSAMTTRVARSKRDIVELEAATIRDDIWQRAMDASKSIYAREESVLQHIEEVTQAHGYVLAHKGN